MGITEMIKNKAYEIGFNLVGICDPEPLKYAYNVLKIRKNNNTMPEMITANLELLTTPGMHMQSVSSIISLAISYAGNLAQDEEEACIASYARGKDYHQVMKEKMNKLITYIKKIDSNVIAKSFSDTVPLLEKEIARKAGLGWIGKNNLLINSKYGSFLVLGEILTNLKLDYDKPLKNGCGTCRICINKCPTGALERPYHLNPQLCISYLTQKKGFLTEKENKSIQNNLWGCDICQLYCPYNQNVDVNIIKEFKPELEANLIEILNFKSFPYIWENSAISWRGLQTIKRNAIIVMANSGKIKYNKYLLKQLNAESQMLRDYSAWALKEIRGEKDD